MIEIRTKLLSKPSGANIGDSITVAAANAATEGMADSIKKHVRDKSCAQHKPGRGTITLIADKQKMFTVQKSGFCCKDFENSIVIETK
ncbi:MAG: hypothetical protein JNL52_08985 [Flavobacteriales bacterium]|nr:hypothetical protein [Flavobacteriales bacterium]